MNQEQPPSVPEPVDPLSVGRIGRYTITRLLSRGGFGKAYLAQDEELNRPVAIQVPPRGWSPETFKREASAISRLDHPNIVPVYEVGSDGRFPCFIVTQFIPGRYLCDMSERLTQQASVRVIAVAAEALHHAHTRGIVHRDVRPANIILNSEWVPYLVNFGLVRPEGEIAAGTWTDLSPYYLSPEQARGEGHRVDARSDVFSLGVVFYELITGHRPFEGATAGEVVKHVAQGEARSLRAIDGTVAKDLDRICLRALARRPTERYPSAADLADDLRAWLAPPDSALGGPLHPTLSPSPTGDAGRAFISYASADTHAAFQLCSGLEARGMRCWIAPRDVMPGDDYRSAIIQGIDDCSALLVLLSKRSAESGHVVAEVDRAVEKGKRVVPIQLEDVPPSSWSMFHPSSSPWIEGRRTSSREVVSQVIKLLRPEPAGLPPPPVYSDGIALGSDDSEPIVPRGLRAFDESNANFFLRLLPGPFDRNGLPPGTRFLKKQIESCDPETGFTVGVVYGPAGSGKTSQIKAALLPRLAETVMAVYLEATEEFTEVNLLAHLRRAVPDLPADLDLPETMTAISRGHRLSPRYKVTVFLDQFERWLCVNPITERSPLIQALLQCDGTRLQCVLIVGDHFWRSATRFMRMVASPVAESVNALSIEHFGTDHARHVLLLFGQAMGKLPGHRTELTPLQNKFLDAAVGGLAQDGLVSCARLSMLAEVYRQQSWVLDHLSAGGGLGAVELKALDELLLDRNKAELAADILMLLLPPEGVLVGGWARPEDELLGASPRENRALHLEVLGVLDREFRMVTRVESVGHTSRTPQYRLAHEGLVPVLRERLTRGRAPVVRHTPLVFISAKSADYQHAKMVFDFLASNGISAFFSNESLPAMGNSDYRKMIDQSLDLAQHMVVVTTSHHHVTSPWVEAEWGFFVQEKRSGRKGGNLITVVADGLRAEDLPPSLRYYEVLQLDPGSLTRLLNYLKASSNRR